MAEPKTLQDLTLSELREQVAACHEHFRRCRRALGGDPSVDPMELFLDNTLGDSDDLELFYECKRIGEKKNGRNKHPLR